MPKNKHRPTSKSKPARRRSGTIVLKASKKARLKSGPMVRQLSRSARRKVPAKPSHGDQPAHGSALVGQFLTTDGIFADDVATAFGLSKAQLAETIGVRPDTLHRYSRAFAAKTQTRLREMLEIIGRVADWAGGTDQAMAWYRAEPIPAFGDRTAEFLVKDDKASAVRSYLDRVAMGGFA